MALEYHLPQFLLQHHEHIMLLVIPKLTLFQVRIEGTAVESMKRGEPLFREPPEVFNTVEVGSFPVGVPQGVVHPLMLVPVKDKTVVSLHLSV